MRKKINKTEPILPVENQGGKSLWETFTQIGRDAQPFQGFFILCYGVFVGADSAACKILGIQHERLIGQSIFEMMPPDASELEKMGILLHHDGKYRSMLLWRPDDTIVKLAAYSIAMCVEDRLIINLYAIDTHTTDIRVSERLRFEKNK